MIWHFISPLLIIAVTIIVGGRESTRYGRLFSNSPPRMPEYSIGEYARQKIANLHSLRDQLKHSHYRREPTVRFPHSYSIDSESGSDSSNDIRRTINSAELPKIPFIGIWRTLQPLFTSKLSRKAILSQIIPREETLSKIDKIRGNLDPSLKNYLSSKYNSFITNIVPYSDKLGIPTFVLNSMKISRDHEPRWNFIKSLLKNAKVEQFLLSLPEFPISSRRVRSSPNYNAEERRLSSLALGIQSRNDDQELVSDQEPDATSKGQKKYQHLVLNSNSRRTRPRKGEVIPDKTGYENQGYDQYGLYGHDSYDTNYGKDYEDYYSSKAYSNGHGGGGGYGPSPKGYGYDTQAYESSKGNKRKTFGTAKGYGGGGGGHGGGGYGGGGGGGYGGGLGSGIMDPFSILGGLAFLTYLGLLLQQSLNQNTTGRAFPNSPPGVELYQLNDGSYKEPIQLTQLIFDSTVSDSDGVQLQTRKSRTIKRNNIQDVIQELEHIWLEIGTLDTITDEYCRYLKFCQLVKYIASKNLLTVFKEALIVRTGDKEILSHVLDTQLRGGTISCRFDFNCLTGRM